MSKSSEQLGVGMAAGFLLALPPDIEKWLIHVGSSVLVGFLTWLVTLGAKALWRKVAK